MHTVKMVLRLVLIFSCLVIGISQAQLRTGFYARTCPNAESIITSVVRDASLSNSNIAPVLLRLHFHDCFVQGCDGSILIDNGQNAEREAFGHQGVGGFEVIENAKSRLEAVCPGVVSCADIVALAARDAVALANGPKYQVPTGRRDGLVSNISLAADMPDVNDSIQQLKAKFLQKGLSEKDLVLLSGVRVNIRALRLIHGILKNQSGKSAVAQGTDSPEGTRTRDIGFISSILSHHANPLDLYYHHI